MTQVSIREQIKKILELQVIDTETYGLKKDLKEKPAHLQEIKDSFEAQKANLKRLEEKKKTVQVEHKSQELELQNKEGEIAKSNTQLSQIKTNKEYQAKLVEIERLKADKSIIEEKILGFYDELDKINGEIDEEKGVVQKEEKAYLAQKKEVEESIKAIEDKVTVLEGKRSQMASQVDQALLKMYEKILENKEGVAMVPVNGNSCGGCFMNVPHQVINQIKMHDKFITCEFCSRILYLEDDL